ncbi:hypothetical protein [Pseudomonas sp. zfem003]|uniref:hypothetical protein n=1 Tax=Pseudomonas sp. zfem003 TaxID=3078198 RepID=UPI0029291253|nr:hypothetical protein [Pseudomonas sp. zfem003]MDU9398366.1 hypothetical protein [Pseudomonas sp. zfem003]
MTIREMLSALRDAGLSQQQIGDLAGVSQPTICRAVRGSDLKYEIGKKIEQLYLRSVPQGRAEENSKALPTSRA